VVANSPFQGSITFFRISPGNSTSWSIPAGAILSGPIPVYEGYLGPNQHAIIAISAFAHSNAPPPQECVWSICVSLPDFLARIKNFFAEDLDVLAHLLTLSYGDVLNDFENKVTDLIGSATTDGYDTLGVIALLPGETSTGLLQYGYTVTEAIQPFQQSPEPSNYPFFATLDAAGRVYIVQGHIERFHGTEMINASSHLCLDVQNNSLADHGVLQQYPCNGGLNQTWLQIHTNGSFWDGVEVSLVNENSGKCLDVPSLSVADGVALQQYTCNGGSNQRWNLVHDPIRIGWLPDRNENPNTSWLENSNSLKCVNPPAGTLSPAVLVQSGCSPTYVGGWIPTTNPSLSPIH